MRTFGLALAFALLTALPPPALADHQRLPSTTDDVPAELSTTWPTVTLTATDPDGEHPLTTYYTTDGTKPTTLSAVYDPLNKPLLPAGRRIQYFSVDAAGNREPVKISPRARVLSYEGTLTGFSRPAGLELNGSEGTLGVADYDGDVLHFVDTDDLTRTSPGGVDAPEDIAFDPADGSYYVADQGNSRIFAANADGSTRWVKQKPSHQSFTSVAQQGDFVYATSTDGWIYRYAKDNGETLANWQMPTAADGGQYMPYAIEAGPDKTIWVTSSNYPHVVVFRRGSPDITWDRSAGVHIATYGLNNRSGGTVTPVNGCAAGGGFTTPRGIEIDAEGWVWVADHGCDEVSRILPGQGSVGNGEYAMQRLSLPIVDAWGVTKGSTFDRVFASSLVSGGGVIKWEVPPVAPTTLDDVASTPQKPRTPVTLSTSSNGYPVTATYYTLDGSDPTTSSPQYDSSNRPQLTPANPQIRYRSVDTKGNLEPVRWASLEFDDAAPETTDDLPATAPTSPYRGGVRVTLTAIDDGDVPSGVDWILFDYGEDTGGPYLYQDVNKPLVEEDFPTLRYWAVDHAGNAESPTTITLPQYTGPQVEFTAPASRVATPEVEIAGTAGLAPGDSDVTVKLFSGDAASGDPVQQWTVAPAAETGEFGVTATQLTEGTWTAEISQQDDDGNHDSRVKTFVVDFGFGEEWAFDRDISDQHSLKALDVSADGQDLLVGVSTAPRLLVMDAETGATSQVLRNTSLVGSDITDVAFAPNGGYLVTDRRSAGGVIETRLLAFDSSGALAWQLNDAGGIGIGPGGSIYVARNQVADAPRIDRYSASGLPLGSLSAQADHWKNDSWPSAAVVDVAVAPNGAVWLVGADSDQPGSRVVLLDSDGNFVRKWTDGGNPHTSSLDPYGPFGGLRRLDVDTDGDAWVANQYSQRVWQFGQDGAAEAEIEWSNFDLTAAVPVHGDGPVYVIGQSAIRRYLLDGPGGDDTTAPATTDDVPGHVVDEPVAVRLRRSDLGGSGVDKTYYTVDGSTPEPGGATTSVYDPQSKPTLDNGERVRYFSVDNAGNSEPVQSSRRARVEVWTRVADVEPAGEPEDGGFRSWMEGFDVAGDGTTLLLGESYPVKSIVRADADTGEIVRLVTGSPESPLSSMNELAWAPDGGFYGVSWDQKLFAYDSGGALKWEKSIPGLYGIWVSPDGTLYVPRNNGDTAPAIERYSPAGTLLGSFSAQADEWREPSWDAAVVGDLAVAPDGHIWLSGGDDRYGTVVALLSPDGEFAGKWSDGGKVNVSATDPDGPFEAIQHVDVDAEGDAWVALPYGRIARQIRLEDGSSGVSVPAYDYSLRGAFLGDAGSDLYVYGPAGIKRYESAAGGPSTSDDVPDGYVAAPRAVTLTTDVPATTYYTLDGSDPYEDALQYDPADKPVLASDGQTIKYFSIDDNGNLEPVKAATLHLDATAPAPSLTAPAAGELVATADVTIGGVAGTAPRDTESVTVELWKGAVDGSPDRSYELTADGAGAFSVSAEDLADGDWTARATQADSLGNSAFVDRAFSVDANAPDTSITATPRAEDPSSSATFEFSVSDPGGSGFGTAPAECKLDAGDYEACLSPVSYSALAEGPHSFSVRAKDRAGHADATPASFTWTVTKVEASLPPEGGAISTEGSATPTDPVSTTVISPIGGDFSINESTERVQEEPSGFTFLGQEIVIEAPPTLDATHPHVLVFKLDAGRIPAGITHLNAQIFHFGDVVPPCTGLGGVASPDPCVSDRRTLSGGDDEGDLQITVLTTTASPWNWGVDTDPPETTITDGLAHDSYTQDRTPTFDYSADEDATFTCTLNGAAQSCPNATATSGSITFGTLTDGAYTFEIHATDLAMNADETPEVRAFVIDDEDPSIAFDGGPSGTTAINDAAFPLKLSDPAESSGVEAHCKLSKSDEPDEPLATGEFVECPGDPGGTATSGDDDAEASYPDLADGSYTLEVKAVDNALNESAPLTRSFFVDTHDPVVEITSAPTTPRADHTVAFGFDADDAAGFPTSGVTVECKLEKTTGDPDGDEHDFGSCSSPKAYDLTDGTYEFTVQITDGAARRDDGSHTFTIDSVSANTAIDVGPGQPWDNDDSPTFEYRGTDPDPSGGGFAFECRFDGGAWGACNGGTKTYPSVGEGEHTFEVKAVDSAGNADPEPASWTWSVDTRPPVVSVSFPVQGGRYSIDSTKPHKAAYSCSDPPKDGVSSGLVPGSCAGPVASGAEIDRSSLGDKDFEVNAGDRAGNEAIEVNNAYRVMTFDGIVNDENPAGYFRLGEESGGTLVDASGNGDGEYKNKQSSGPEGISGDGDYARAFFGEDGYGYVNGITATPAYTIGGFFKFGDLGDQVLLHKGSSGAIWLQDGQLHFRAVDWNPATEVVDEVNELNTSDWFYVLGRVGAGEIELWVDGVRVANRPGMGPADKSESTFYIGFGTGQIPAGSSPAFNGAIDEVAIFPAALSDKAVGEILLADPPPKNSRRPGALEAGAPPSAQSPEEGPGLEEPAPDDPVAGSWLRRDGSVVQVVAKGPKWLGRTVVTAPRRAKGRKGNAARSRCRLKKGTRTLLLEGNGKGAVRGKILDAVIVKRKCTARLSKVTKAVLAGDKLTLTKRRGRKRSTEVLTR